MVEDIAGGFYDDWDDIVFVHTGGVFGVATADGAGHWLSDTIDFQVYNFLGNRGDGDARGKLP